MKANYSAKTGSARNMVMNDKQIENALNDEWNKKVDKVYDMALRDVSAQVLAVFFTVMNKEYGFGKTRLLRLKKSVESVFHLMNYDVMGRKFSTEDCIKYIKDNFDIDFDKESVYK